MGDLPGFFAANDEVFFIKFHDAIDNGIFAMVDNIYAF
jgi:hypothetical protein